MAGDNGGTRQVRFIERVDDYRFENRIDSRSEAIRILLDWAREQNPSFS